MTPQCMWHQANDTLDLCAFHQSECQASGAQNKLRRLWVGPNPCNCHNRKSLALPFNLSVCSQDLRSSDYPEYLRLVTMEDVVGVFVCLKAHISELIQVPTLWIATDQFVADLFITHVFCFLYITTFRVGFHVC